MSPSQRDTIRRQNRESNGRPRVVVAEDDAVFRALLSGLLRDCGLEVCEARDGVELLEILAQSAGSSDAADRIDLVVSDVCVPEYGSIELLLGIHAAKMKIPLIAITAFGERRTQVLAHHSEAPRFEEESFDLDGFRALVLELLGDRNAPRSMRITLRPQGSSSLRPSGMVAVAEEVDFRTETGRALTRPCASTLPPQLSSLG